MFFEVKTVQFRPGDLFAKYDKYFSNFVANKLSLIVKNQGIA